MKKIVVGSMNQNAGKTSVILGIAKNIDKKFAYMKPLGDRLVYKKKRQWDSDHALMTGLFGMSGMLDDATLGFDHSKIRYMYDEEGIKKNLNESADHLSEENDIVFIEGGCDPVFGSSVNLDVMSIAEAVDGELIFVIAGNDDALLDKLRFLVRYLNECQVTLKGVIFNKVKDVEDFKASHMDEIEELGVDVLGMIPYKEALTYVSMEFIVDRIFAKVIAGHDGLRNTVKNVFVGAMVADAATRDPAFQKDNKLVITAGDRADMILAALESNTAGIIITNDMLPNANIISKAHQKKIPILQVKYDTFSAAKKIDDMIPRTMPNETEKVELLMQLVKENVSLEKIFE